jgi:nitrile hydratase subunit beta
MNGVHDMGGFQDFGPVRPEPGAPPFHHAWERRVLGLTLAMGATGAWNIDQSRAARESLPPALYLSGGYYRIWMEAMGVLLQERGLATASELREGRMQVAPGEVRRVLRGQDVGNALARGTPVERTPAAPALFKPGDRVRTREWNPPTHTRLPRYCRGKPGTIVRVHGFHVFADAHALGQEVAHWLYNVRFEARDLWGEHTTAGAVHVDCWEPYLCA